MSNMVNVTRAIRQSVDEALNRIEKKDVSLLDVERARKQLEMAIKDLDLLHSIMWKKAVANVADSYSTDRNNIG